jgi:small basic protein (TIGR04137 family)
MSIDKSLKTTGALSEHRNVLKRAERIEILKDEDRWSEDSSPFGLIKVAHRKAKVGGKVKKKVEAAAAGEGEKPAEGAPAAEEAKK